MGLEFYNRECACGGSEASFPDAQESISSRHCFSEGRKVFGSLEQNQNQHGLQPESPRMVFVGQKLKVTQFHLGLLLPDQAGPRPIHPQTQPRAPVPVQ